MAEGYKNAAIPKVGVLRAAGSERPCCTGDPQLIALVSDDPRDWSGPVFSPEDISGIASFLVSHFRLERDLQAQS